MVLHRGKPSTKIIQFIFFLLLAYFDVKSLQYRPIMCLNTFFLIGKKYTDLSNIRNKDVLFLKHKLSHDRGVFLHKSLYSNRPPLDLGLDVMYS